MNNPHLQGLNICWMTLPLNIFGSDGSNDFIFDMILCDYNG